jgi:cytochrome bd-type quinol oxidase subunit 2
MKHLMTLLGINLILVGTLSFLPLSGADALTAVTKFPIMANSVAANEACNGVGLVTGNNCDDNGTQVSNVLGTIITIFSAIVGIVAVIMIIVAGLQFITSNGNPQNISKARTSLIYAIVGIVVVVLAQTIVHFVINKAKT